MLARAAVDYPQRRALATARRHVQTFCLLSGSSGPTLTAAGTIAAVAFLLKPGGEGVRHISVLALDCSPTGQLQCTLCAIGRKAPIETMHRDLGFALTHTERALLRSLTARTPLARRTAVLPSEPRLNSYPLL